MAANDDLELIRAALLGGTTGRLHGEEESECLDALVALDRIKAALAVERASNTANMAELLRADELLGVERARVAEYKASEADWRERVRTLESKLTEQQAEHERVVGAEPGECPEGERVSRAEHEAEQLLGAIGNGEWDHVQVGRKEFQDLVSGAKELASLRTKLTEQQAEHKRVVAELEESGRVKARALAECDALRLRITGGPTACVYCTEAEEALTKTSPVDSLRAELVEALRYIATANDANTAPRHIAWQLLASRLERKGTK